MNNDVIFIIVFMLKKKQKQKKLLKLLVLIRRTITISKDIWGYYLTITPTDLVHMYARKGEKQKK